MSDRFAALRAAIAAWPVIPHPVPLHPLAEMMVRELPAVLAAPRGTVAGDYEHPEPPSRVALHTTVGGMGAVARMRRSR